MIYDYLNRGVQNAITRDRLALLLGCDARVVTQALERERQSGFPVCASNNPSNPGYYIAADARELEAYLRSLRRRLKSIATTCRSLQATLDRMEGQETLWEEDVDESFI